MPVETSDSRYTDTQLKYIEETLKGQTDVLSEIAEQLRVLNTHLAVLDGVSVPPFLRKGKKPV